MLLPTVIGVWGASKISFIYCFNFFLGDKKTLYSIFLPTFYLFLIAKLALSNFIRIFVNVK